MLIYVMTALCALLLFVCIALARSLRSAWARSALYQAEWERKVAEVTRERDYADGALWSFMESAQTVLFAVADEVERATGHSDEAHALGVLARDVKGTRNPFNVVSNGTADDLARVGVVVPQRPLHIGQALTMAVELDQKARRAERGLYQMTRLCLIDKTSQGEARWLAETLALMQRLCGDDAAEARRKLRAAIEVWEYTEINGLRDIHELGYRLESAIRAGAAY